MRSSSVPAPRYDGASSSACSSSHASTDWRNVSRFKGANRSGGRVGAQGVVLLAGVALTAAAQERHRARLQAPAVIRAHVRVAIPTHAQVMVGLIDEQQWLLAGSRVAIEIERRCAGEEQPFGSGLDQR